MNIRDRIKELRRVPANELRPNPRNWRTHPEKQLNAIRGVLAEVGFAGAELARELEDGTLELIDGHARAEVAGTAEVPVLVLDVNEAEANKILATFDPIGAMADSDAAKLDAVLRDVETANEDLSQMIADLANEAGLYLDDGTSEIEEDEVPEPPADPITKPGDLWVLGRHRLLCGDSTVSVNIEKVLGSKKKEFAVVTDPPYGTGIAAEKGLGNSSVPMNLLGDENTLLAEKSFSVWQALSDEQVWFGANYYSHILPGKKCWLVWDKDHHGMTYADAELAWTNSDSPTRVFRHAWSGMHRASERQTIKQHPTQKPVAIFAWIISNHVNHELICDPFLGSGSTLIAAEQLGRTCYGMELSPAYCDVIVERWQNLTGEKAKRA